MRPAFNSGYSVAAFTLVLLFLLAAPWLIAKKVLPRPTESYSSESIKWEKYPWVQKFIFDETNDIDIAFVGSSHIGDDIDTPYVQRELTVKLGRKSVVRTFSWFFPGFDALFFNTRDLLAHRKVKTLVFYDECAGPVTYQEHNILPQWHQFELGDKVMAGLPLRYQAVYYYAAVIGSPRILLAALTPNLPVDSSDPLTCPFAYKHTADPESQFGCIGAHLGFSPNYGGVNANFTHYVPQTDVTPADVLLFGPTTASKFVFSDRALPRSQLYFARQFALLAKAHGCNLLALHLPSYDERTAPAILESRKWTDLMETAIGMVGIPPARLFAGLSESQIQLLYSDPGHLNINGQQYFTPIITPELLKYHATHTTP